MARLDCFVASLLAMTPNLQAELNKHLKYRKTLKTRHCEERSDEAIQKQPINARGSPVRP